jgi:cytochrome c peroxidase
MHRLSLLLAAPLLTLIALPAWAGSQENSDTLPWGSDPPAAPAFERVAAVTQLGRQLFFDPGLSASGKLSCASCHTPANHFAPLNSLAVQRGGSELQRFGLRATPSLTYVATTPFFSEHYYESDEEGDESVDQGPTGGRTWDGRVNRARDQAVIPLLDPNEMANANEQTIAAYAARSPYATQLRILYGEHIFDEPARLVATIGQALETYQQTPAEFSPFTSKYDAVLRHEATLTPRETRGLLAFNDPAKGNCMRCHKSQLSPGGNLPMFTDSGFVAIGVPRNREIPANADPRYFDLGACGPIRKDLRDRPEYCGFFKAPSLRNVATRHSFYHNGVFHTLEDAVSFYATRDTNPERWYPKGADGTVRKFDDLPSQYQKNIDYEPPFGGKAGGAPSLSPEDVADIVAFLQTLTDGYRPDDPGNAALRAPSSIDRQTPGSRK